MIHGYPSYDLAMQYPGAMEDCTNVRARELAEQGLRVIAFTPSDLAQPEAPARVVEATEKAGRLD